MGHNLAAKHLTLCIFLGGRTNYHVYTLALMHLELILEGVSRLVGALLVNRH